MDRFYQAMREVLEAHDGRVAKFIGDAVVAIFGVPAVREDDALRAVQAAGDGEILIGETPFRHVRHAAECEPVAPLTLKGKRDPVSAFLLVHAPRAWSCAPGRPGGSPGRAGSAG